MRAPPLRVCSARNSRTCARVSVGSSRHCAKHAVGVIENFARFFDEDLEQVGIDVAEVHQLAIGHVVDRFVRSAPRHFQRRLGLRECGSGSISPACCGSSGSLRRFRVRRFGNRLFYRAQTALRRGLVDRFVSGHMLDVRFDRRGFVVRGADSR
jgi:hypothetical protein